MSRANIGRPKTIDPFVWKAVINALKVCEQIGSGPDCHLYLTNKIL
jgi:hypothetical protein